MYIALDIGGTNIRIAASESLISPSASFLKKIPATNNYNQDFDHIVSTIHELSIGKMIQAIGCGYPGTFSEDKRTISVAPNLPDWNNKQFVVDLEKQFSCPVRIENDDTISALGEATYGYGKEKDFVYVTCGTGFGAADVKQKEGEITIKQFEAGHHIISWENGRLCGCGQRGCAEAYVGGGNIEKYYKKKMSELGTSEWEEVLKYLANALINIVAFYPTKLIVIGGGMAIHNRGHLTQLEEKIRKRLQIYQTPEIYITELGDDLGLMGAFALQKLLQ